MSPATSLDWMWHAPRAQLGKWHAVPAGSLKPMCGIEVDGYDMFSRGEEREEKDAVCRECEERMDGALPPLRNKNK